MSLPQSNIDWARYMEGLQGKANLGLNNTADKLAGGFISKLMPDYTAGIKKLNNTEYTAEFAGYLEITSSNYGTQNITYLTINGIRKNIDFVSNSSVAMGSTSTYLIDKGDTYKIEFPRIDANYQQINFYPLKGAN